MQLAKDIFSAVIGLALAAGIAHCNEGCAVTVPPECRSEAAYSEALKDCVRHAQTVEESQMCRQNVNLRCGIVYP